ncbi:MAG: peptide chain release factor 2 [Lachnospiraceae bacterium]|nr:peptide chain release factor 2 [Lachnospiraceae bacterium]
MLELDQLKQELGSYKEALSEIRASLDLERKEKRIEELDRLMEMPDFWNDPQKAQQLTKENKDLKDDVQTYHTLKQQYEDIETLIEMGNEEDDADLAAEAQSEFKEFLETLDVIQIKTLLSDEYDHCNAILKLTAGAGGTESCDWASMLYRMYTRWAEKKGLEVEELSLVEGDEAGIKTVDFQINGTNAYGLLKSEKGVHRLVRISPFNAQGKRQTSFVRLEVVPELDEDAEVEINDDDIRIDTYRSSGAGGQHINKTSSAIRITHFPTGIVVTCQNERSQFQNKDKAMQMLKSKLFSLQQELNAEKISDIRGEMMENAWGSQIRSYFLQPTTMVKDLRTNAETSNADAVLSGDIDMFINAYLKMKATESREET